MSKKEKEQPKPSLSTILKRMKEFHNACSPTNTDKDMPYLIFLRKKIKALEKEVGHLQGSEGEGSPLF
jgi:hypothetical protein